MKRFDILQIIIAGVVMYAALFAVEYVAGRKAAAYFAISVLVILIGWHYGPKLWRKVQRRLRWGA